ncbi:hypothetical protein B0T16DRAFT_157866 [Cercophora newfieldiana]|uniref:Uncharacterized protein n=1 Tax=Cercophora newfieldiana TaxID=92897 RepID=A0AA39Y6I2_9PEZI|nr:hypothetical protein B0T16DRAFT_157866 [Cercophora newfieldiana]
MQTVHAISLSIWHLFTLIKCISHSLFWPVEHIMTTWLPPHHGAHVPASRLFMHIFLSECGIASHLKCLLALNRLVRIGLISRKPWASLPEFQVSGRREISVPSEKCSAQCQGKLSGDKTGLGGHGHGGTSPDAAMMSWSLPNPQGHS